MRPVGTTIVGTVFLAAMAGNGHAQVRVGTWNLTDYGGDASRTPGFQTAMFATYQGRSFAPDVLIVQEVSTEAAMNTFRSLMNAAAGSPGDYLAAPFTNGPNTDSACFYRSSRLTLLSTDVAVSASTTTATRHVMRYRLRLANHSSAEASFYLYSTHLKASDTSEDAARRGEEAVLIRNVLNQHPAGTRFIVGGDFNLYTHTEPAWTTFTAAGGTGRLYDPINRAGVWSDGASFAVVHTQSPAANWGGMDDRFDFLMVSDAISTGDGLAYIGDRAIPYGSVWNDPNHSYRAWGNDGLSFNQGMRIANNTMVGPVIAQGLVDSYLGTSSPPHLPVFMDLQAPARAGVSSMTLNFGTVNQGAVAQLPLTVTNIADVALWSKDGTGAGIDELTYSLGASSGFQAPGGTFTEPANAGMPSGNVHQITMDTGTIGVRAGTLVIASDDPESPALIVNLSGMIVSPFDYDVNNDGVVNIEDLYAWHVLATDVNGNGVINGTDREALAAELRRLESGDVTSGRR